MLNKIFRLGFVLLVAMGAFNSPAQAAFNFTPVGKVTHVFTCCASPSTVVTLDSVTYNPENCSLTDGYMIPDNSAATQLISSIVISAYAMKKNVKFAIDGCYYGRPAIIGIDVVD